MKKDFSNPFATRFVAPGRMNWVGCPDLSIEALSERFPQLGCRAQIIGPHGSGKTTLLHHLLPQLGTVVAFHEPASWSRPSKGGDSERVQGVPGWLPTGGSAASSLDTTTPIHWFQLRKGHPIQVEFWDRVNRLESGSLLVVDGFEQLSRWNRWRTRWLTRQHRSGLLVTGHRSFGLPTLTRTRATLSILQTLVERAGLQLAANSPQHRALTEVNLEALLKRHRENLRECLMELYDVVEVAR
jgi:hypothetical protein